MNRNSSSVSSLRNDHDIACCKVALINGAMKLSHPSIHGSGEHLKAVLLGQVERIRAIMDSCAIQDLQVMKTCTL